MPSHSTTLDAFEALIQDISAFHAQDIYSGLGPAIADKKPYFRIIFRLVSWASRSRFANMMLLLVVIIGYRAWHYPQRQKRVFQYGVSANNIKSFKQLNGCLAPDVLPQVSMNGRAVSVMTRLRAILSIVPVWRAACALKRCRQDRPLPHVQAVIGCATLLVYARTPLPPEVDVICVASDHSPVCQALLFMARHEGRKTCYIQHAPVTDYFPPLNYDLSILHDRDSLQAYGRAAQRRGISRVSCVVLLSLFETAFAQPSLGKPPYKIGICLSFLPDIDALSVILAALSAHRNVHSISIRPHPRCRQDLSPLLSNPKVQPQPVTGDIREFFAGVDIVLVPNSGVAIEALHNGCPTFFTPGADQLPDDYYGFVAAGVLPVFSSSDLDNTEHFLNYFDAAWVKRFSRYDETVDQSPDEARATVSNSFLALLKEASDKTSDMQTLILWE